LQEFSPLRTLLMPRVRPKHAAPAEAIELHRIEPEAYALRAADALRRHFSKIADPFRTHAAGIGLSGTRPIVPPGAPFSPASRTGSPGLAMQCLTPDLLRDPALG
jgi:hypothetical protein